MNIEMYDTAAHVPSAVRILFKLILQVFVQVYRFRAVSLKLHTYVCA